MRDERYARYLEQPATLAEPAAAEDGERVLDEVLDEDDRRRLVRRVAAAIGPDEGEVRELLPPVAALAMAALGERLRDPPRPRSRGSARGRTTGSRRRCSTRWPRLFEATTRSGRSKKALSGLRSVPRGQRPASGRAVLPVARRRSPGASAVPLARIAASRAALSAERPAR